MHTPLAALRIPCYQIILLFSSVHQSQESKLTGRVDCHERTFVTMDDRQSNYVFGLPHPLAHEIVRYS